MKRLYRLRNERMICGVCGVSPIILGLIQH